MVWLRMRRKSIWRYNVSLMRSKSPISYPWVRTVAHSWHKAIFKHALAFLGGAELLRTQIAEEETRLLWKEAVCWIYRTISSSLQKILCPSLTGKQHIFFSLRRYKNVRLPWFLPYPVLTNHNAGYIIVMYSACLCITDRAIRRFWTPNGQNRQ